MKYGKHNFESTRRVKLNIKLYYTSKHEYTMELLAAMTASEIAKRHNISRVQAFDKFIQSKTADMLFDDELNFWWNGSDYLTDEYEKEMSANGTFV